MRSIAKPRRLLMSLALAACTLTAAAQTKTVTHEIKRGETIESIARSYGTTVEAIKQANPNAGDYFFAGMKIQVPVGEKTDKPPETAPAAQSGVKAVTQPTKQPVNVADNTEDTAGEPQQDSGVEDNDAGLKLRSYMGLHYMQGFEEGAKGSYGLSANIMNAYSSYFGISFLLNTNVGIVDAEYASANIGIGPNFNYMLSDNWGIFAPLYFTMSWQSVPVIEENGTKTSDEEFNWGFMTTPSIAFYYKKINIGLGFALSWAKGADKLGTGFIANIGYAI